MAKLASIFMFLIVVNVTTAANISDQSGSADNLYRIYNDLYGTKFVNSSDLPQVSSDQVWTVNRGEATARVRFAEHDQNLTIKSLGQDQARTLSDMEPLQPFVFQSGDGIDRMVTLRTPSVVESGTVSQYYDDRFMIAWECDQQPDYDYNDLVVEVWNVKPLTTVVLAPVGDVTTWPDTAYRWMDIADNLYSDTYQSSFTYNQPLVNLSYYNQDHEMFRGVLTAHGLKPNFAYQIKLVGKPTDDGRVSNESIGYKGRWWRQKPNPGNSNDAGYDANKNNPNYAFECYLMYDYFVTDESGNAVKTFGLDNSYHVLWKISQRNPRPNDSVPTRHIIKTTAANPAYGKDCGETAVELYAEWETGRAVPGNARLDEGDYNVLFILTEESFHSSGLGGYWASAMGCDNVRFTIGSR